MFRSIQRIDERVLMRIKSLHSRTNNRIMTVVTGLGNFGLIWFALSLPLLITRAMRAAGANIVFALFVAWLTGEVIIKHIVGRVRPSEQLGDEEQIIKRPKYYSFPSGHTTSSFAVLGVALLRCSVALWLPVLLIALLIGFSRIYLRVHYLSDVIVGAILGFVCGVSSVPLFNAFALRFFAVTV